MNAAIGSSMPLYVGSSSLLDTPMCCDGAGLDDRRSNAAPAGVTL